MGARLNYLEWPLLADSSQTMRRIGKQCAARSLVLLNSHRSGHSLNLATAGALASSRRYR